MIKLTGTLRSSLVKVKQARPDRKKKDVVYEVLCKDCPCVYIGETGRTLEKRLSEHKTAVKKHNTKNGIAVYSWANQHQVNWDAATVKQKERGYWKRRVLEALHIHQQPCTSNPDCGLCNKIHARIRTSKVFNSLLWILWLGCDFCYDWIHTHTHRHIWND